MTSEDASSSGRRLERRFGLRAHGTAAGVGRLRALTGRWREVSFAWWPATRWCARQ